LGVPWQHRSNGPTTAPSRWPCRPWLEWSLKLETQIENKRKDTTPSGPIHKPRDLAPSLQNKTQARAAKPPAAKRCIVLPAKSSISASVVPAGHNEIQQQLLQWHNETAALAHPNPCLRRHRRAYVCVQPGPPLAHGQVDGAIYDAAAMRCGCGEKRGLLPSARAPTDLRLQSKALALRCRKGISKMRLAGTSLN